MHAKGRALTFDYAFARAREEAAATDTTLIGFHAHVAPDGSIEWSALFKPIDG